MKNYNSKLKITKILEQAIDFHGHLGPYLVLGLLAGELALKKLKCKKYFGLEVKVWGANKKPESCLVDGLQFSTGATYGKGNICKLNSNKIKMSVFNLKSSNRIEISLKKYLVDKLGSLNGHRDSEVFARKLLTIAPIELFDLKF